MITTNGNSLFNKHFVIKGIMTIQDIIDEQIHLGFFSGYRLVKNGSIQSATCKSCSELLTELHHEIINCKLVLLKIIDSFKMLISNSEGQKP